VLNRELSLVRNIIEALTLKLIGTGLSFGFNIALARRLGTEGAGAFYLSLTIMIIASLIARMGLDSALVRFTAVAFSQGNWAHVGGLYAKSMRIAVVLSLLVTAAIVGGAPWMAHSIFSKPLLVQPLRIMALSILPFSLLILHSELLRGVKRTRDSVLIQSIAVPAFNLLLLVSVSGAASIERIAGTYAFATFLALALGWYLWRRATPLLRGVKGEFDSALLIGTSAPLFWVALIALLMSSIDSIVLGIFSNSSDVGVYSVTLRIATIVGLLLVAVNTVTAPQFAELYAQGKLAAIEKLAMKSARLTVLLGAPVLLVCIVSPALVLGMFGPGFARGATALMILAVGQFINAATGSVGYLLTMSGNEKPMRNSMIVLAIAHLGVSLILVPRYGIIGAAVANAISVASMNLTFFLLVYKKLSISTISLSWRKRQETGL
jgi:O-antigen/teichoic acid export membrane protein